MNPPAGSPISTSVWQRLEVEDLVVDVLKSLRPSESPRVPGRPYVSAYQLAIMLDARYPEVRHALGDIPIGGADSGSHFSLASYLARQLIAQLQHDPAARVEGATLSRQHVGRLVFNGPGGRPVADTNIDAGYDVSLFRLRN